MSTRIKRHEPSATSGDMAGVRPPEARLLPKMRRPECVAGVYRIHGPAGKRFSRQARFSGGKLAERPRAVPESGDFDAHAVEHREVQVTQRRIWGVTDPPASRDRPPAAAG